MGVKCNNVAGAFGSDYSCYCFDKVFLGEKLILGFFILFCGNVKIGKSMELLRFGLF